MSLPLPITLSPSKVSSFKDCALAFRFSAIDRLPEPPSAAATKGTLVHKALERLFGEEPGDRTLDAALAHLAAARADMAEDPELVGLALDDDEEAGFMAQAADLVTRYFQLEDPRTVRPVHLEHVVETDLDGLTLRGIIDRLELDADGEWVVTDYKTGKPPPATHELRRMAGVHFYAYLCEQALGRRPARIQLLYLSEPVAIIAIPSEQSIRGLQQRTTAIWQAVERACEREDFRPRTSRLCDWCAFRPYCPAFGGDPAQARELLPTPSL
jgi:putative RecB family exonuclease